MPRVALRNAVATRDSITNLWAMAEKDGEVTIRLADKSSCYKIRNKLYSHRSQLRKRAQAHSGIESSHLDGYKISYREEFVDDHNPGFESNVGQHASGKWLLTISFEDIVEFELLVPDDYPEGELPHFDTLGFDEPLEPPSDFDPDNPPY